MTNEPRGLRVVLYIRVSTKIQVKENMSLEDQRRSLMGWAKEHGHTVVKIYEDAGLSAYKGKRPAFNNMLNAIDTQSIDIDCIAVYDATRFCRNEATRYNAENILQKNGIAFYSLLDSIPDDSDDAFLMKGVNGLFAEGFSRKNSKKSAIKLNSVAEDGYVTGSPPPFGLQTVYAPNFESSKKRKVYAIHPKNSKIVKKIFSLALTGQSGCSYGLKKIASYLNDNNILRNGSQWTANSVHNILRNTACYGERKYGVNRIRKDLNSEIVIIPVPPIIKKVTFDAVQKLLKSKAPMKSLLSNKAVESPKLLTGSLKCAKCGCNMIINSGKSGRYHYYKCRDQIKRSINVCNCPILPREKIEKAVTEALIGKIFTIEFIEEHYEKVKLTLAKERSNNSLQKANLQRKWNHVDSQVSTLMANIADGQVNMSKMIRRHLVLYEEKLSSIETSINKLDKKSSLPLMRFGKKHIESFVDSCVTVLLGGNTEATKALILATVKDIKVYEDKVDIRGGHLPLLANVSNNKNGHPKGVPTLVSMWR